MRLVVDVNIMLSALLKDSTARRLIVESSDSLYFPEISLEKIRKYKEYVLLKSALTAEEFDALLDTLFKHIELIPTSTIKIHWGKAKRIMEHIDPEDVVFIASALALDGQIWSDDKHFDLQKEILIWKTQDRT